MAKTRKPLTDAQKAKKAASEKARRQKGKVVETIDAGGGILVDVAEPDGGLGLEGLVAASQPVEEPKPDPRIAWPTRPQSGYCASASEWHTWQSKCGRFQVARIVSRQGAKSGFSCQFRANPQDPWELIAHTKEGPTYTRLFKTLRECLDAVEQFAQAKLGHGSFNMEQCLSEAEKMGMDTVPITQDEKKTSRHVAEEVPNIVVPPYVSEENTVKISKSSAVALLKAVGVETANAKQPLKVLAKNIATLPKLDGIGELQLDDDDLQTLLADVLKDLEEDGKKGVEVVEDTPASKGKGAGKPTKGVTAKPSKNGSGEAKGARARSTILGYPTTAVLRWMGESGFSTEEARNILRYYKVEDKVSASTVPGCIGYGRQRAKTKDHEKFPLKPAPVTKEDKATLTKIGKGK